jgi:uncharacterized protein YeaO (DUF488 family)
MGGSGEVRTGRVYDPPGPGGGARVLVDRLCPMACPRTRRRWTSGARDVAPSNDLRKWYQHDPEGFAEFTTTYTAELDDPERAAAFAGLVARSRQGPLTPLTATKQVDISHAAVLAQLLAR